ncbi:gag protein [Ditylenchus destructor]|uniref:Gag protein n=1 Tax=Ditylenchus destructor TaxID=166010 RepID=A0AAD4RA40_9BILA|nr:gag protein [Ditylenchus destructor]
MTMLFVGAFIVSGYNGLLYFAMYPRHALTESMNQSIRQFFDYGFPEDEYIQVSMIGQPATLPLLAVLIGVFCVFVCTTAITIGSLFSLYFISFLTVPVPWIPVINPLITLMIVKPYRNFMFFDRGRRQIDVSMTGSRTPRNMNSANAHPRRPISAYKAQMSDINSSESEDSTHSDFSIQTEDLGTFSKTPPTTRSKMSAPFKRQIEGLHDQLSAYLINATLLLQKDPQAQGENALSKEEFLVNAEQLLGHISGTVAEIMTCNHEWVRFIHTRSTAELKNQNEEYDNFVIGEEPNQKHFMNLVNEAKAAIRTIEAAIKLNKLRNQEIGVNQPAAEVNQNQENPQNMAVNQTLPADNQIQALNPAQAQPVQHNEFSTIQLPRMKPPTFDGNPIQWPAFWDIFEASVHNKQISGAEKLSYLLTSLYGEAKQAVSGYQISNDNYPIIVDLLKRRYGNKQAIAESLQAELIALPKAGENVHALKNLSESIERICRQMSAMQISVDHPIIATTIKTKLPYKVITTLVEKEKASGQKWNATQIRQELQDIIAVREEVSRNMQFDCHSQQKQERFNQARNHRNDREKVSHNIQFEYQSHQNQERHREQQHAHPLTMSSPKTKCHFCNTELHWSEQCRAVTSQEERKRKLTEQKRCFLCLSDKHAIRQCQSNKNCWHCKGRHNSAICSKRSPDSSNSRQISSGNQAQHTKNISGAYEKSSPGSCQISSGNQDSQTEKHTANPISAEKYHSEVVSSTAQIENKRNSAKQNLLLAKDTIEISPNHLHKSANTLNLSDNDPQLNLITCENAKELNCKKNLESNINVYGPNQRCTQINSRVYQILVLVDDSPRNVKEPDKAIFEGIFLPFLCAITISHHLKRCYSKLTKEREQDTYVDNALMGAKTSEEPKMKCTEPEEIYSEEVKTNLEEHNLEATSQSGTTQVISDKQKANVLCYSRSTDKDQQTIRILPKEVFIHIRASNLFGIGLTVAICAIYFAMKTAINMIKHIFSCRKSTVYGSFKSAYKRNKAKKKKRKRQHLVKRNLLTQEQSDEEGNTLNKEPKLRSGLKTCKISITSAVGRMAYIAINANWTLSNFVPISQQCANVVPINSMPYTQSNEPNSKTNIEGNSIVRSSLYQHIKRGELFATEHKVAVSSFHFSCIFQAKASSLEMETPAEKFHQALTYPIQSSDYRNKKHKQAEKETHKTKEYHGSYEPYGTRSPRPDPSTRSKDLEPNRVMQLDNQWMHGGPMELEHYAEKRAIADQRKSENLSHFCVRSVLNALLVKTLDKLTLAILDMESPQVQGLNVPEAGADFDQSPSASEKRQPSPWEIPKTPLAGNRKRKVISEDDPLDGEIKEQKLQKLRLENQLLELQIEEKQLDINKKRADSPYYQ